MVDYDKQRVDTRSRVLASATGPWSTAEGIACAAVQLSFDIKAYLIICLSSSGTTARLVSKYRPHASIMVVTHGHNNVSTQVTGHMKGVALALESDDLSPVRTAEAIALAVEKGLAATGDSVVVVHGHADLANVPGSTSMLHVMTVV